MRKLLLIASLFLPSVSYGAFTTDWLRNTSSSITINSTTYTWNAGNGGSGKFLLNENGVITSSAPTISGSISISTNTDGSGSFIWNQNILQSGATFYVSSGTVKGKLSNIGQIEITNTNDFDEAIYVHMPQENTKYALRVDGYYSDGIRFDGEFYTNNASISNLFAINDNSIWKPSTANTAWSIGAAPIVYGTSPAAALYGFVSSPTSRPSPPSFVYYGTATKVAAYMASPFWSTGQVSDYYGFYVSTFNLYSTVDNAFGLFVSSVTGATNNYAIKSHEGLVDFGSLTSTAAFIFDPSALGNTISLYVKASDSVNGSIFRMVNTSPISTSNKLFFSQESLRTGFSGDIYDAYTTMGMRVIDTGFLTAAGALDFIVTSAGQGGTGAPPTLSIVGDTANRPSVQIKDASQLRYYDSDNSNYISFRSPNAVGADVSWILPNADASGCFQSDGSGNISIASCGSGSGGASSLEVFSNFDAVKSSPTASIAIGDALKLSVSGSTGVITVDFSSVTSRSDAILNRNTLQAGSTFFVRAGNITNQGLSVTDSGSNAITLNGTGFTSMFISGVDTTFTFDGTYGKYSDGIGDYFQFGTNGISWDSSTAIGSGSNASVTSPSATGLSNTNAGDMIIKSGNALGNGQGNVLIKAIAPGQGSGTTTRTPTTSLSIGGSTITAYVPFRMFNQNEIRFMDSDSSNYSAFRSSETLAYNQDYVLPDSTGTLDQVLAIQAERADGKRTLYWKTDTSGGGGSLPLTPGDTNYIQVKNDSLQPGSTFYVSSGTVQGQFTVNAGTFTYDPGPNASNSRFQFDYTEFTGADGTPVVKFYDKYVSSTSGLSPGNPRSYFDNIGGFNTISYVNISGSFGGSGDSFRIIGPWETFGSPTNPAMLSIRSDIDDAAIQVNATNFNGNSTNGYIMLAGRYTNQQTFAINHDGGLYWSSGTTQAPYTLPTANSNFDTNLYRSTQDMLKTDDSFDVGIDLTVGGSADVASSLTVDSAGGVSLSQIGATPPSEILSFSSSNDRIGISKEGSGTSGAVRAAVFVSWFTGTSANSGSVQANNGFAGTSSGATGNLTASTQGGGIKPYRGVVDHNGTGTVTLASGFTTGTRLDSTGTITDVAGFNSEGVLARTGGGRIDNYVGFWAKNGAAISTVQYGVRIDAQTIGTTNYAIAIDGTGQGSAIFFNTPTRDGREKIGSYTTGNLNLFAGSTVTIESPGFRLNAYSTQTVSARGDIAIDTNAYSSSLGTMLIHDGTQILNVVVTTNTPSNGQIPKYNSSTGKIIWDSDNGGTGSPGGSDTYVQFNDGGSFGGDAEMTYDKTNNLLTIDSGDIHFLNSDINFTSGNDTQVFTFTGGAGASVGTITVPRGTGTLSLIEVDETYIGNKQFSSGIGVQEGSNEFMGVDNLVAGTVTVSNTSVTANSRIFLTAQNSSGGAGNLYISARSAGASFTITSTDVTDTRSVAWLIIEPY